MGRLSLQHAVLLQNYRHMSQNQSISAGETYSIMCRMGQLSYKSIHFDQYMCKNHFYIFVPSHIDF